MNLATRRVSLETSALCASLIWTSLLAVNPDHMRTWRESRFPGGYAHACELETSAYLRFGPERVQMDKAVDHIAWYNLSENSKFGGVDLFGGGPLAVVEQTSTYMPHGVMVQVTLATPQKGAIVADEVADRLVEFATLLGSVVRHDVEYERRTSARGRRPMSHRRKAAARTRHPPASARRSGSATRDRAPRRAGYYAQARARSAGSARAAWAGAA